MSYEDLSEKEKKDVQRIIKLGKEAGKRLEEFAKAINKKARKARKSFKKLKDLERTLDK